ncbi:TPA: hypothetical protein DDZ10_04555 [Candidatus Uhrbacteria bacterium]|uniref:Uncharacterized protein n=1 Tax=Candidatus Uhrbacteria bacterium GW2011_GWC2_53_7 TaxID=1618986 RepID=A0A0G1Y1M2_9BACT|nr:MAG: hypothetical protein UY79_C0005G0026 [Parcubacteria group bacterium GW2011_GWA2_53_21]KKW37055.1 MAG: hypothetical protein UY82_C0003G0009 [Candidatus Uhrbacteria bacterium GW2011_GWC2_53_7]HBL39906.1 hypothetical protein [Candidatus Uhrbacteria bacterium]
MLNYTTATMVFLAVFLLNRYAWQEPIMGTALLVFFFGFYGQRLGKRILARHEPIFQTGIGALVLSSAILILGTFIYYLAFLPSELWTLFVLLAPVGVWLLTPGHKTRFHFPNRDLFHARRHRLNRADLILVILSILLLVALFQLIGNVEIFDAVRSTWERIPHAVLWLFFLLLSALGALAMKGHERSFTLPLVMLTLFLAVGIAALVYPLGFGFDSFLHQATESHIAQFGTIDPKPFYYIGQYVVVLFTSEAFTLPLVLVDRFLLPVLAAVLLPLAWYFASASLGSDKRAAMFSTLGVFLLPLSAFIVTTPQGLANLFTILLVLLSLPYLSSRECPSLGSLWLIGLATFAIHPLAGIPALLYLVLMTLRTTNPPNQPNRTQPASRGLRNWRQILRACGSKFRRQFPTATKDPSALLPSTSLRAGGMTRAAIAPRSKATRNTVFFWLVALLGSVSLPTVFILNALFSGLELNFSFVALTPTRLIESLHMDLIFQSGFNTFLDFVYIWSGAALLAFVLITIYILVREKTMPRDLFLPALMAMILFVNYALMKSALDFTFLINYERSNYADRLITLIFFFLTPYVALFLMRVWHAVRARDTISRTFTLMILVGLLTSQLYLTYPRRDNYDTSRGFNTGAADFLAVDYIEEHAPDDYIVLANQQVSAAAVYANGFKRYYGDVFYYPIPTGSALYQFFLQMNERPSREIMQEAMKLAQVNTAYYVVNDYWWQSERLIETAKLEADDWLAIDNGKVHVFRYNYINLR